LILQRPFKCSIGNNGSTFGHAFGGAPLAAEQEIERNHELQRRFIAPVAQPMIVTTLQKSAEGIERSVKWFRRIQFDKPDLVSKPISASRDEFRRH
jgi:hypothetical protein